MMLKTLASLAMAAGCLTMAANIPAVQAQSSPPDQLITNGPQGSPPADWSARQNVRQSERYQRLVDTNRAFRQTRMRKECGPVTDAQLHAQCIASFSQDQSAMSGSSTAPSNYGNGSGR
jgi:hypothetical protein